MYVRSGEVCRPARGGSVGSLFSEFPVSIHTGLEIARAAGYKTLLNNAIECIQQRRVLKYV